MTVTLRGLDQPRTRAALDKRLASISKGTGNGVRKATTAHPCCTCWKLATCPCAESSHPAMTSRVDYTSRTAWNVDYTKRCTVHR